MFENIVLSESENGWSMVFDVISDDDKSTRFYFHAPTRELLEKALESERKTASLLTPYEYAYHHDDEACSAKYEAARDKWAEVIRKGVL